MKQTKKKEVLIEYRMLLDECVRGRHSKCKRKLVLGPFTTKICKCPCHTKEA